MKNQYPAIVVISSFLLVLGTVLFFDNQNPILGWVIGVVGGAGAMAIHVIGEFNGK